MKLCRYDNDRLGLVQGDEVLDVTPALSEIPTQRWPIAQGDPLIRNLDRVLKAAQTIAPGAPRKPLASVTLKAPVANPSKIIGAPINYNDHIAESKADVTIAAGREIKTIGDWGLFLKANSSLIGFGEQVQLRFGERRNDHEIELALIIGKQGNQIPKARAREYIAAYAIGLDMTIRGPEFQCFRKSVDTYSVLGPWMVTADEVADPNKLDFWITVNGESRQKSNTSYLVFDCERLIEYASSMYTLHPGDVIMTGTPAGVGPVKPGDEMECFIQSVGQGKVRIAPTYI